jgi:hypothetical protein
MPLNFNATGRSVGQTIGKFGLGGVGLAFGGPIGGLIGRSLGAPLGGLAGAGLSSLFGPRGLGLLLNRSGIGGTGTPSTPAYAAPAAPSAAPYSAPSVPSIGGSAAAPSSPYGASVQNVSSVPGWGSAAYSPHIAATRVQGMSAFAQNNLAETRKRNII